MITASCASYRDRVDQALGEVGNIARKTKERLLAMATTDEDAARLYSVLLGPGSPTDEIGSCP